MLCVRWARGGLTNAVSYVSTESTSANIVEEELLAAKEKAAEVDVGL
jgi:hypothetical protein